MAYDDPQRQRKVSLDALLGLCTMAHITRSESSLRLLDVLGDLDFLASRQNTQAPDKKV
jgi:hypothetical protein